jgi:hypothetical protein
MLLSLNLLFSGAAKILNSGDSHFADVAKIVFFFSSCDFIFLLLSFHQRKLPFYLHFANSAGPPRSAFLKLNPPNPHFLTFFNT